MLQQSQLHLGNQAPEPVPRNTDVNLTAAASAQRAVTGLSAQLVRAAPENPIVQ